MNPQSFTVSYVGRAKELITECRVGDSAGQDEKFDVQKTLSYHALWDTGASGSVISKALAENLNLSPISKCRTYHAQGESIVNVYLVDIVLPNRLAIRGLKVSEGILNGFDVLIGMDIITLGDFVLTNREDKTTFSFQIPSTHLYDFVKQAAQSNATVKGRKRK